MKQQHVSKKNKKGQTQIVDNRRQIVDTPDIDPSVVNMPVRTILYVEVGDMEKLRVQLLIQEINKQYDSARGGVHYVIPVRHGKIGSDIVFEQEFLNVVNKVCEIKDGQIVLKDGAKEVHIVRDSL